MEQLIGQSLDRYQIVTLLGEGGMGAVFKARDVTLQRDVAVKVMHPQLARRPNFQERFLQEARTAARMDHPGIVKVFDFGQARDLLYIVMEFIPGANLRQMLQDLKKESKWIVLPEALQLVRQVALALDYAHDQGVLHRDIKPDNIMLKAERGDGLPYRPVLTDLGLAKLLEGGMLTQEGMSMGTPAYMSPEQALGEETDARSDVYSVGILLYELAVGRLPFAVKTITEAIRCHTKEPPPVPRSIRPDLPEGVERVILRAIEKDAGDRYADAASLARGLGDLAPAEATAAATAPPTVAEEPATAAATDPPTAATEEPATAAATAPPTGATEAVSLMTQLQAEPAAEAAGPAHSQITLYLEQSALTVQAGNSVTLPIILLNKGSTVEQVQLSVHGIPDVWLPTTVPPVRLLPGMQQEVSVIVRPPRSPNSRAGAYPLVVRATGHETSERLGEARGTLMVEPFADFATGLHPQRIHAGQVAQVTVRNKGNAPETYRVTWQDRGSALAFRPPDVQLTVTAGQDVATEFRARPRRRRWLGGSEAFSFTARVTSSQGETRSHDGKVISRATVPVWALALLAAFLCVVVAGAAAVGAYQIRDRLAALLTTGVSPTPTATVTPAEPVVALPDLAPIRMKIELETGGSCSTATELGVRVWIENAGAAPAGSFTVDVNGEKQVVTAGVAAHQITTAWFPGYVTGGENSVYVDAGFQVEEGDEDNNLLSQQLPIPTPVPTCTPSDVGNSLPLATETGVLPPSATPYAAPTRTGTSTPTGTVLPTRTPTPTVTPHAAALGSFNDFETSAAWTRGDQSNGTFERTSAQAHGGSNSGKLSYQFSTAGNDFVVFMWDRALAGTANQITAWVKGDGSGHFLNVWVKDNGGETWQFTFGRVEHTGWQQMTAYLDTGQAWPAAHIAGPGNGVLDHPVRFHALVLDDVPDTFSGSGTIYVDDLASAQGGAPPPAPLPGSASIDFRADRSTLAAGECTTLRWDAESVQGVYFGGAGVSGHGSRQVCPDVTTTYTLHVVLQDSSTADRMVTIAVGGGGSQPPPASACQAVPGETYSTLAVNGPPTDRPAAQHGDLNLALRGYEATSAHKGLVDYTGKTDANAPQLPGLFPDNRTGVFATVYRVHDWDWSCNCRGPALTNWEVTMAGLAVSPGEVIHVPDSGHTIGSGYNVLVLYAATDRITLQYTPEDSVVNGYTLHVENVCVEPNLLALYQMQNNAGRAQLPALRAGQAFGRATGSELGIAIRDHGTFLDPRSRKDWWKGR